MLTTEEDDMPPNPCNLKTAPVDDIVVVPVKLLAAVRVCNPVTVSPPAPLTLPLKVLDVLVPVIVRDCVPSDTAPPPDSPGVATPLLLAMLTVPPLATNIGELGRDELTNSLAPAFTFVVPA
jgi:hypothetical protein